MAKKLLQGYGKIALEHISNSELDTLILGQMIPKNKYTAIAHRALMNGKITRDDLENAINKNIFSYADMVYQKHLEGDSNRAGYPFYLDECGREDFFAHALEEGHFNWFEKRKMRFDHGHTVKSYIRSFKDSKLLDSFIDQIAYYSPQKTKRSIASQMSLAKSA